MSLESESQALFFILPKFIALKKDVLGCQYLIVVIKYITMNTFTTLNFDGVILGAISFLIIGIFHPLVIKIEYYMGVKGWILFLVLGILFTVLSLLFNYTMLSAALGVLGFSCFWSIKEVFDQRKRVLEGRFPKNPKRNYN